MLPAADANLELGVLPAYEVEIVQQHQRHGRRRFGRIAHRCQQAKGLPFARAAFGDADAHWPAREVAEGIMGLHPAFGHFVISLLEGHGGQIGQALAGDVVFGGVQPQALLVIDIDLAVRPPADDQVAFPVNRIIEDLRLQPDIQVVGVFFKINQQQPLHRVDVDAEGVEKVAGCLCHDGGVEE